MSICLAVPKQIELFFLGNTRMLYGDGQEVVGKLIAELKQL